MQNPRIPPQTMILPFPPPLSITMRVRIPIGLFSERINSGFCAFVSQYAAFLRTVTSLTDCRDPVSPLFGRGSYIQATT